MIFYNKKYVFETKQTRLKRYLKNSLLMISFAFFAYIVTGLYILYKAQVYNKVSESFFFKKDPAVIAIFTGDAGRISYALKKAQVHQDSRIFITGVYNKNSVQTLLEHHGEQNLDAIDLNRIEIDYTARNTVENVLVTLFYLREKNEIKNVLIISSDYHMLRISYLIDSLRQEKDPFTFYYLGTPSNWLDYRGIKIITKEVYKFFKTVIFLFFWDQQSYT